MPKIWKCFTPWSRHLAYVTSFIKLWYEKRNKIRNDGIRTSSTWSATCTSRRKSVASPLNRTFWPTMLARSSEFIKQTLFNQMIKISMMPKRIKKLPIINQNPPLAQRKLATRHPRVKLGRQQAPCCLQSGKIAYHLSLQPRLRRLSDEIRTD